jgi:hypothetical protein
MKKGYEKAQQEEAFKELLTVIGAHGGKLPYGAMDKLVKKYQGNGYKAITRQNLYYRLKCRKEDTTIDNLAGKSISIAVDTAAVLSDFSGDTFYNNSSNEAETSNRSNIGGRKKGSTVRGKAADEKKKR